MKLSEYAKRNDVTWRTAYRWYQEGKIPGAHKTPGGSIVVPDDEKESAQGKTVIYARVSNSLRRKTDLEYQAQRLVHFCIAHGWTVDEVIKEVGSGLNDKRPKLLSLLLDEEPISRIVVEHKDRITRFGFSYIEALTQNRGCEIVVVNKADDDKEELIEDFTSIITSFCARIYGQRRGKRKTEALTEELEK